MKFRRNTKRSANIYIDAVRYVRRAFVDQPLPENAVYGIRGMRRKREREKIEVITAAQYAQPLKLHLLQPI